MATIPLKQPVPGEPSLKSGVPPQADMTAKTTKPTDSDPVLDELLDETPDERNEAEMAPVKSLAPLPGAENPDDIDAFILSIGAQQDAAVTDAQAKELIGADPDAESGFEQFKKKIKPIVTSKSETKDGPFVTGGKIASEMLFKAPVKGVRDAIQETIDLRIAIDESLNELAKGTNFEWLTRPLGSPAGTPPKLKEGDLQLPDPTGEMETMAGGIEKNIVQFITGFVGAGKVLKGANILQNSPLTANALKSAMSTFAAFDGHQERLSNMIQGVDEKWRPDLIDTVTKYLAAEEDDPELLGRLKGTIEDAGFGMLLEPVVQGIRAIRAATKIKKITKATTFEEAAKQVQTDYGAILKAENQPVDQVDNLLGPSSSDTFVHKPNEIPVQSEPIRAYHGTTQNFDQFENSKLGSYTDEADSKEGFYFTTNSETAGFYPYLHDLVKRPNAEDNFLLSRSSGGNVRPVNLDLKNPKIIKESLNQEERLTEIVKAKQEGNDSVIFKNMSEFNTKNNNPEDIIVVFDPKQIKSQFDIVHDETMSGPATAGLAPTQYGNQTIHVNFNRIDTPEDLIKALKEMQTNKPVPKTEPDGRPIAPQPVTFVDSQIPGTEATWDLMINSRNKRIKNGQSTPLRVEDQEALKALYVSASNKLDEVIKVARAAPTSENLFAFRKMLSTFGIINNELMGIRHETNRAINIWRKSEQVPMRRMKDIEETLERTGGIEDNKKLLDQLAIHLDSDPKAGIALAKMAQASRRYGTVRAIRNFWTLGLLTNWKTHEVNAISNTFMMFQLAAERAGAAKYTQALGIQGGVAPGEASAMLSGMWQSLGDAMRNAGRTFRSGEGGGAFNKVETPFEHNVFEDSDTALKKFVNTGMWYWGSIGRALQASDEFFKTLNFAAATNAEIQRKVYWEVQSGKLSKSKMAERITALKNDIPEEILLKAEDLSRYATFTKEPGQITKNFSRLANRVPGARYIVPFINTPSNLFNASIERTPFAPLQKTFKDAVRRGGADEALAITKMTMGSSLMAMSMSKAFDGEITGSGPPYWSKDYARWKAEGKQPYSIKRGDKWIAYNRFDPMGMVLGLGADMAEKLQNIDESDTSSLRDWQNLMAGTVFSIASQVTSKTYMQSAANFFEALNNPDVNANSFLQMFAGGLIPSGVGEVARQVDPVQRQAYDFVTKWKARIPGLSSTLEPKLDQWGREQKYGTGNTLVDVFNPVNITQENITPIDREFDLQGWSIPKEITKLTHEKADINLRSRPEVANQLIILSRRTPPSEMGDPNIKSVKKLLKKYGDYGLHNLMNMIVTGNHPLYQKYMKKTDGKDGEKVIMLKSIYKDYYEAAKDIVIANDPEIQIQVIEQAAQRDAKAEDIAVQRKENPTPVMPSIRIPSGAGDSQ